MLPKDRAERALARSGLDGDDVELPGAAQRLPDEYSPPEGARSRCRMASRPISAASRRSGATCCGNPVDRFSFGAFSGADAMFAPVVNRFDVYDLVSSTDMLAYMSAMKAHPAWRKWEAAARAGPLDRAGRRSLSGQSAGIAKNASGDWSTPLACISAPNSEIATCPFRPPVWPWECFARKWSKRNGCTEEKRARPSAACAVRLTTH